MASDWEQIKVGDLLANGALAINDGYRVRSVELGPEGIPFVRGGDIGDGTINFDVEDRIQPQFTERVRSKLTRPYDVAFITKGTVGRVGFVRPNQPEGVFAPQVCYWRSLDWEVVDPRFLYYLLTSAEFQANLDAVKTHGSMVADYVSMADQKNFRLTFPSIRNQRAIGRLLGSLDDKIELNRRMNATLEGISRAIFKSWFVDFDPVRQKAAGQQPVGMDAQTAALFPDSFEDSEIGEVPKGWRVGTICDYADLNPESWSKATYPDEVRYVDLSSTKWGEVEAVERHERESAPSRAQRILRIGDTIFGTVRPGNGSFAFVEEDGLTGSTGFAVIRPKRREWREYVYVATTEGENVERLAHLADGGAYPAVRPEVVAATPIVDAPLEVVERFSDCTSTCFTRISENRRESRTLAALRDTLLPKLLSGEVRVAEAEQAIEEILG